MSEILSIKKLSEYGFQEAMRAIEISYHTQLDQAHFTSLHLKERPLNGESKFLEMLTVYLEVRASLKWWMQFDSYRIGVTKMGPPSLSNLLLNKVDAKDFVYHVDPRIIDIINDLIMKQQWESLLYSIPIGYYLPRVVKTDYKTLRYIMYQRKRNKLKEWQDFISKTSLVLSKPEYLYSSVMDSVDQNLERSLSDAKETFRKKITSKEDTWKV